MKHFCIPVALLLFMLMSSISHSQDELSVLEGPYIEQSLQD
ncbi:hypothetical protein [Colwellia sp. 12G3]|nr:hypothetical protein [Colwellia sp. 12G3]